MPMGTWAALEEGCVIFLTFDVPLVKFDWAGSAGGLGAFYHAFE